MVGKTANEEVKLHAGVAGLVGNIAILYRFHPAAFQRKIHLP
jgi:hypothetical protein